MLVCSCACTYVCDAVRWLACRRACSWVNMLRRTPGFCFAHAVVFTPQPLPPPLTAQSEVYLSRACYHPKPHTQHPTSHTLNPTTMSLAFAATFRPQNPAACLRACTRAPCLCLKPLHLPSRGLVVWWLEKS
jgi:hypothetical protein